MGKVDKRHKGKNAIIIIFSSLILIALIFINVTLILETKKESNKKVEFSDNIKELEKTENQVDAEIKKISTEIEDIKNIDSKIQQTKTNYYKTLKEFEDKVYNKEVKYKIAYLTFDDGPYYSTYKFLDVLEKNDVRATFFTIGSGKEKCYDNRNYDCTKLFAEEAKRGHTIANHTYSHAIFYGLYSSPNSFITQVQKQEDLIKQKAGVKPNIVRFPGGSVTAGRNKNGIIEELRKKGYGWVDWTSEDGDGRDLPNGTVAMRNITTGVTRDIEVILMHDYSEITLGILPDVINYLKQKGYVLLPLFYESRMVNK